MPWKRLLAYITGSVYEGILHRRARDNLALLRKQTMKATGNGPIPCYERLGRPLQIYHRGLG